MRVQTLITALIFPFALTACATQNVHSPLATAQGKCDQKLNYSIPSTHFDEAAQQIAHATGCFIESDLSKTAAIQTQPIEGKLSPREAIQDAIKGTSLKIIQQDKNRIVIE